MRRFWVVMATCAVVFGSYTAADDPSRISVADDNPTQFAVVESEAAESSAPQTTAQADASRTSVADDNVASTVAALPMRG